MQTDVCFIIFSGFNERSVICLCRTLRQLHMPFCIIALSQDDPCYRTDYATDIAAYRAHTALDLADIDVCLEKAKDFIPSEKYVIAPSSEFLNIFLLDNRKHFEDIGIEIPLPTKTVYKQLSDKQAFVALCKAKKIPTPEEIPENQLEKNLPIVAKPICDITADGTRVVPEIIETLKDLKKFKKTTDGSHYFYQQYIRGSSYYLLIYRHANGETNTFSQRNLLQQPNGKSIVLASDSNLHHTSWITPYLKILKETDYRGLAMIEVKEQDGKYYMIEANPRMWGPAQLMADAGSNLFISFINDYSKTNFPWQRKPEQNLYAWNGGIAEITDNGGLLDAYANVDEVLEALQSNTLKDIYGRSDTATAFRSDKVELNSNNIREIL